MLRPNTIHKLTFMKLVFYTKYNKLTCNTSLSEYTVMIIATLNYIYSNNTNNCLHLLLNDFTQPDDFI